MVPSHARIWLRGLAVRSSRPRGASAVGCRAGGSVGGVGGRYFASAAHCNGRDTRCGRGASFSSQAAAEEPSAPSGDFYNGEDEFLEAGAPVVEVASDGGHLTLQFPSNDDEDGESADPSTFHASWLWSNDPRRVVLPSGQRSSTPGGWRANSRPRIKEARIVHCNLDEPTPGSGVSTDPSVANIPGPTETDCCHPLAVYGKHPAWMSAIVSRQGIESARPYLHITWTSPSTSAGQPENEAATSIYDVEWLKRFRYNSTSRLQHRKRTEVQPLNAIRRDGPPLSYSMPESETELASLYPEEDAPTHGGDGLMHVDYHSIIGEEGQILQEGLFRLLHSVFRDGAAIVSGTPLSATSTGEISHVCRTVEAMGEDELPVAKVAKAMSGGDLSHGALYGNVFHVRVGERDSNNVAYTSASLCPHQDLAYYESPPGMQLLHCVAMGDAVQGGESTLIDAMAAAHRLREVRPESFECLVRCPATFVKQRNEACMTYRRPHIVLAEDGGGTGLDREITAVFWSPPFEGPVSLPPHMVDRYYEAYADFERMLNGDSDGVASNDELAHYASEFTWERKLDPGDMLVFNNRRMLHGRCGFSAAKGASLEESQRHLVGCYTNIDDTLNSYRVLLRERDGATSILNVGNGTNIVP